MLSALADTVTIHPTHTTPNKNFKLRHYPVPNMFDSFAASVRREPRTRTRARRNLMDRYSVTMSSTFTPG
jgi:hypothetical protein